jgi:hypothetical protein
MEVREERLRSLLERSWMLLDVLCLAADFLRLYRIPALAES